MEEFRQHLNQFYLISQQLENVDINHFVQEIELIGRQLKYSQEFLFREIQRLKQDSNVHSTKLNQANELRKMDQNTLKTFKTKFQDLSQLLTEIREKEINTWHLVQILRVNTSRLWHIFETTTGSTVTREILYEDLQKLLHHSQLKNDEQTSNLRILEKEHAALLLQMKETQLSLEDFRTTILQITQSTNERKLQVQKQQQLNDRLYEQTSTKINQVLMNTKDMQRLLLDYKSLVYEIDHLLKLIFNIQTQIEIHQKSILIYQTKLEKYKQDLTVAILNRTNDENEISDLRKIIHQQNQNLTGLEYQQTQILQNRQHLHQQIHVLEHEKTRIISNQQQLLDSIKRTTGKNRLLERHIFQSNQTLKNLNVSQRKLIQNQNKQQEITNQVHRTIETNERLLQGTQREMNQFTEQINQQDRSIDSTENRIESQTKELSNLESCLSTTHEELLNHRTKVNESKIKVKSLTQKMHKLIADEKPLTKEIAHYQRQLIQNQMNHAQLELSFKQNETKISQYRTIIAKLIHDSQEDERILTHDNLLLEQYQDQIEKSKEDIKTLSKSYDYSEDNYQDLQKLSSQTEKENRQLKQQYADLTFVVQLLGQRQVILSNQLKPLYDKIKYLIKHHRDKVKTIEQSKSDLNLLHKYYLHLQFYHRQLQQSLSLTSRQHHEYPHSQSISNHIHYWQTLMIGAPEKFNQISKLLLIKKKLVKKSNKLFHLKQIFHQKNTLYRYLNGISERRQRLIERSIDQTKKLTE